MSWELKSACEAFPSFATEWDRLNGELYDSHPMFDSRFVGPLLVHFCDGRELLCIHRTGETIDGALILRPRGLGRWMLFAPAQTQAGAVLIEDARVLETLLPALPGHAWSLDLLSIDPAYAPNWSGLSLPHIVIPHTLTMAVATNGDFHHYWQARPKKLRDNIRRYQRRADETVGPLSVAVITSPTEVVDAIARYGRLESVGWKAKEGTAIAPDNPQGRFYADVLGRFATRSQALAMEMRAGERLIASRLFISHERMWIALKTTYDETQSAFAPGRLLMKTMLERAFANMPVGSVEFYTNASRDPAEWATTLRPILHHQIFRNELAAGLLGLVNILRRRPPQTNDSNIFNPLTVRNYPNIAAFPPAALVLFQQAETHYPELASDWFANLQQTVYGNDLGVRYYLAERANQPVAILPVRLAHHGIVRQVLSLSNFYTSLYRPILSTEATELDLTALLQAASRDHCGAHVMRFAPMDPAESAYATTLTALRSMGWVPYRYYCFGNWYIAEPGNWASYLKSRSSSLRSNIKRAVKKFHTEGGELVVINGAEDVERWIRDFMSIYAKSWKRPEPYPNFIPGLIRWLATTGRLRLGIALLKGQPISAQLWITCHQKAHIYKVAYDENFHELSPGTLVTSALMEHVTNVDAVRKVDFLIGDDEYKQKWMSNRTERWGIVAYNPRTLVGLILLIREYIGRIFRRAIEMARSARRSK
jgi:CelD/BcsL family acetyltransferase involved in cellulose biosynthesis